MSFFIWSTCALLNCLLALVIVVIMVSGESAYKFVGLGSMIKKGREHPLVIPTLLLIMVLATLIILGVYCFAAAGDAYWPFAQGLFIGTTVLYLLRGAYIFVDPFVKPAAPTFVLMASYAALAIGGVQALAILVFYAL